MSRMQEVTMSSTLIGVVSCVLYVSLVHGFAGDDLTLVPRRPSAYARKFGAWSLLAAGGTPPAFKAFTTGTVNSIVQAILVIIMLSLLAFAAGALYGTWKWASSGAMTRTNKIAALALTILFAATITVWWWITPQDYASCILKTMPGTANSISAMAKRNLCESEHGAAGIHQYVQTIESERCIAEYAATTPDKMAVQFVTAACVIKYGATFDPNTTIKTSP